MAELVSIKRNVDVSPGQAAPAVFHCSQGDVGSKIILGLLNNGTAYSIPSGVTVTIEGSESNGSIFTPISATASGSDITFYLTGEMTAVAGPAICQAVLKSGSNILGTANFTLEVESSPMGADAPPVFTDAGWTWMLNKLTTEFVPALGDNIIDAIDSKADQSDLTALSNTVAGHTGSITVLNNTVNTLNGGVTENRQNIALKLDKNQGTANAGKYLKVGAGGNVETADLDVTTDKTLSIADKAADAKAVGDELDVLKADLTNIDRALYPNADVVVASVPSTAQSSANTYYPISLLKSGNAYRIILAISDTTHLSNIRTSKAESGSGNMDLITDEFVGDSWVSGKTAIYTPSVDGIAYLQIQFNSAYVANEASITLTVYDYTKETTTAIQELETANTEVIEAVDAITPEIYLEDEYNLLPPFGYTVNKFITSSGVVKDYAGNVLSDYIPIDPTQGYICNWAKTASIVYGNSALTRNINPFDRNSFCFFDENKNVVPFTGSTSVASKAIPENARYIRVTIESEELYPFARLIYGNYSTQPIVRICDYHKRLSDIYAEANTGFEQFNMVMFGDSITHGSLSVGDDGTSYVDYANDYLHSNIINVGFGGTRMTYPTIEGVTLFCFRNLVDCIVSDDATAWDALDTYASSDNTSYLPHLNKLKAVEWDKIHAIGLMYGANDFTSNTPVGSVYNENILNFDGACASALKKLLTKYPHLQVILFGPFDRMMDTSNPETMTDTTPNSAGLFMRDYANSLENVVQKFHCPLVKTGELFGINVQTVLTYAPDGTHPRANIAQKRLGWLFAQAVRDNVAPFN